MRQLPPSLQAHLDSGATTTCRCWRVIRRDGRTLGFTDHDEPLEIDGTLCEAAAGLEGTETVAGLGMRTGSAEVAGALTSERISQEELETGAYDGASVETWLVNWAASDDRLLLSVAEIGEVRLEDGAFSAELRGPAHRLQAKTGRVFSHMCDAAVGDERCGVDLNDPLYRAAGAVVSAGNRSRLVVSGLETFAHGWFARGRLMWTSGDNADAGAEVRSHTAEHGRVELQLWQDAAHAIAPGDTFAITAGCDKHYATCRAKFANGVNFRGFPHMPGNDFAISYPIAGERSYDGGKLR